MTSLTERTTIIDLINQAILQGARQAKACATIDLSERTLQRWQKAVVIDVANATAYAVVPHVSD